MRCGRATLPPHRGRFRDCRPTDPQEDLLRQLMSRVDMPRGPVEIPEDAVPMESEEHLSVGHGVMI